MSDEKLLTKEIAEQFLADEDSVDLSEFTAIEDDAAEVLSKHKDVLCLDGLTSLSNAAAESLSKHKGDEEDETYLSLNGLTSLSDPAAESLSKHEGALVLNGLTSLSDPAAESLSKGKPKELQLDGVSCISDDAILLLHDGSKAIFGCFGKETTVPTTIPDNESDFRLAQFLVADEELGVVYLRGPRRCEPLLGELTLEEADRLSAFSPDLLTLNGWYSVESLDVLRALGKGHFSQINLRFDEVTVEIATVLSDFKAAGLGIESDNVGGEAARVLLNYQGRFVGIPGLKSAFRWSESHEIFDQHHSFKAWGEVKGLDAQVELEGQCQVCGNVITGTLSVNDIIAGIGLGGLFDDGNDDAVTYGPDDHYSHFGAGVCLFCRDELTSADEDDEGHDDED